MQVRLEFRIEAIKPDKMPALELVRYMHQLALLLGAEKHVHFTAIRDKSIGIDATIGYGGRLEVRNRMREAQRGEGREPRRYWSNINGGLARRKLKATLTEHVEGKPPVVRLLFPGVEASAVPLPAVRDQVDVRGKLFRIEGRDRTVHAGVEADAKLYSLLLTRDQAKEIAPHLFGLVKVQGEALRTRNPDGVWETGDITVRSIAPIEDEPLLDTIAALRAIGGFGWSGHGGLDEVQRLRDDG